MSVSGIGAVGMPHVPERPGQIAQLQNVLNVEFANVPEHTPAGDILLHAAKAAPFLLIKI